MAGPGRRSATSARSSPAPPYSFYEEEHPMMLTRPKPPSQPRSGGPLSTRGGTIFVAALLSLVAAVALLLFLRDYRNDLTADDGVRVVVLKSLVPHGTSGEAIAENSVYRMTRVKKSELAD